MMPGQPLPFGPDQVLVLLIAVVVAGFWAACKLRDLLAARRVEREQVRR